MIQQFDVVVGDHDGVVHHHAKDDDQRRNRDLVEFNSCSIEHPEGQRYSDGDGDCRDESHPHGQEHHGHKNDGYDRDPKFTREVEDTLGYDTRLIGNELQLHIGRQRGLDLLEGFVQRLAELDDIVSFVHLDGEQDGWLATDARILGRVLVEALHIG